MQTAFRSEVDPLTAYLPATLVQQWARKPDQPPVWGDWLSGSLMFCDISGFTAMSEHLARLGKEGAELMAAVLNQFFERMIGIALDWGGAQMKFGGDAMLLLFSDERHVERAAASGLEMQAAMAEFRRVSAGGDIYRLRMRIAIHSGRFFAASVGQPDGILHYLLVGPDVNRTAEIEGAGQPGQVVLSRQAVAQLGPGCVVAPASNGVWRMRNLPALQHPHNDATLRAPQKVLQRYLLPPLAAPLIEGRLPSFSGEHRRVTAVFINVLGISPLLEAAGDSEALRQTDAYIRLLISALERHGGFLAGSDLAHEGDKLICLFGAPLSLEREEAAALRAVLEFDEALGSAGLSLRHRIGLGSGAVFAGEIGSSKRREYTVIGDSVNLAARLMAAAAPGEILVSRPTAERAGTEFHLQRLKALRVKGKAAPVPVLRLRGSIAEAGAAAPQQARETPLVGREAETKALAQSAEQVSLESRARWAYIWGEPGIGKSRLTAELRTRLVAQSWRSVTASCHTYTSRTPFAPWRAPLQTLLDIAPEDGAHASAAKVSAAVQKHAPELVPFASLLGELLALPAGAEPSLASLDARERRHALNSLVVQLLASMSAASPLLLLFEDAHWSDAPSLDLLAALLRRDDARLLTLVTSREAQPAEIGALGAAAVIRLRELSADAARTLIGGGAEYSRAEAERILARAQGNPLFLQEIARIGLAAGAPLPDNVNDVILARLDRLPPEQKTVLRTAAVIGESFRREELNILLGGSLQDETVGEALDDLRSLGFTRDEGAHPASFAFAHILTREVAYETLPFAQRRHLHRRAAQHIEARESARLEAVCDLLLHHYELASDTPKVVRYSAMSGDRAAAVFATAEAMEYYHRSLAALAALQNGFEGDRSLLMERLGDCLDNAGLHKEATDAFSGALGDWRSGRRSCRLLGRPRSPRSREADLSRKVAVSCERRSDYDESLNWVNEALRVLPGRPGLVGAQVFATKSLVLFRKGLYDHAVLWGRRGLDVARRNGEPRQVAYAHHILAGAYMELGKLKQALFHDRLSARIYHELGDLPGQARANSNLGLSYQMLGVLDAALYHYEVALRADERLGNVSHSAIVRNNIGEVLLVQSRLDEAEEHLLAVVSAYKQGMARTALAGLAEVNLARCALKRENLTSARRHLSRGLRLLKSVGAEGLLTEALLQRVELLLAEGRPRQARRECHRLLAEVRELEAKVLEARAQRLLGRAEAGLGRPAPAIAHFREAVALARQAAAGYEEGLALLELGRVTRQSSPRSRRAGQPLRRAASILAGMGAAADVAEAERLLAALA